MDIFDQRWAHLEERRGKFKNDWEIREKLKRLFQFWIETNVTGIMVASSSFPSLLKKWSPLLYLLSIYQFGDTGYSLPRSLIVGEMTSNWSRCCRRGKNSRQHTSNAVNLKAWTKQMSLTKSCHPPHCSVISPTCQAALQGELWFYVPSSVHIELHWEWGSVWASWL